MPGGGKSKEPEEAPERSRDGRQLAPTSGSVKQPHNVGKTGMPARREGRFTVAETEDIRRWLGKEAHMPASAHVLTKGTDIAEALKESISSLRHQKRQKKFQ